MSVTIPIEFPGASEAEAAARAAAGGLREVSASAIEWARQHAQMGQQARELTQRLGGVTSAVSSFASAISSGDGGIASLRAFGAAAGQVGALFGPTGALIGGITSLATQAIPSLIEALAGIPERQAEVEESTRDATDALQAQADVAESAADSLDRFLSQVATSSRVQQFQALGEEIAQMSDQLARLDAQASGGNADAALEARELRARIAEETARAETERIGLEQEGGFREPRPSGGGGDRGDTKDDAEARFMEEMASLEAELLDVEQERLAAEEERQQLLLDNAEKQRETLQGELELRERLKAEEAERIEQAEENHERQLEIDQAKKDATQHAADEARSYAEDISADAVEMMGKLGTAITEVIVGSKSAEEAFTALLASFLASIAEQAALSAVREYAEAIASFARYDYSGGAQHIAAGVAFTALAVAAGAGSVALSQPSAAKPTGPEERDGSGGGRGGDVNVYINSPMVTAQTKAELGRELRGLIDASEGF